MSKTSRPGATSSDSIPLLRECVSSLKHLSKDLSHRSPKQQAEIYSASIAFLCHLKEDQAQLFSSWNLAQEKSEVDIPCPHPQQIPAMTVLTEDLELFQSLVNMLGSRTPLDPDTPAAMTQSLIPSTQSSHQKSGVVGGTNTIRSKNMKHHIPHHRQLSRKRPASLMSEVGIESSNQVAKSHQLQPLSPVPQQVSSIEKKRSAIDINLPILAATILYVGFQHLDHWPVPLVTAYAEDSFGLRRWVDDARCKLLVDNIKLVLENSGNDDENDPAKKIGAEAIARFYSNIKSAVEQNGYILQHSPVRKSFRDRSINPSIVMPRLQNLAHDMELTNDDAMSTDSDSGDEECVIEESVQATTTKKSNPGKRPRQEAFNTSASRVQMNSLTAYDNEDSSSSGEDEEEMQSSNSARFSRQASSKPALSGMSSSSLDLDPPVEMHTDSSSVGSPAPSSPLASEAEPAFPVSQVVLDLSPIRPRYFGINRALAHDAASSALSTRLESNSKQNSGLLGALPIFASIPKVRSLIAKYLERWMQSPALSGLARSLFKTTVSHMRNVDPPLMEDIDAIDSILSMHLKANQFTTHIGNITCIAQTIPNFTISRHIFCHLLRDELRLIDSKKTETVASTSDQMQMFVAVYTSLHASLASRALASTILALASDIPDAVISSDIDDGLRTSSTRGNHTEKIRRLLRRLADALGPTYDGFLLVKALLCNEMESVQIVDMFEKARIVFECMTLIAPPPPDLESTHRNRKGPTVSSGNALVDINGDSISLEKLSVLRKTLLATRKVVAAWCCSAFSRLFEDRSASSLNERITLLADHDEQSVGAGTPVFNSILDGTTTPEECDVEWSVLSMMRCLLFLVDPDSSEVATFLCSSFSDRCRSRIRHLNEYGTDIDDELLIIILDSAGLPSSGISPKFGLCLIENLFSSCQLGRKSSIKVFDYKLIWKLYSLVEYVPSIPAVDSTSSDSDDTKSVDNDEHYTDNSFEAMQRRIVETALSAYTDDNKSKVAKCKATKAKHVKPKHEVPQLAFPGMWWRATAISLIICGNATKDIGAIMWEKHPTLRALMKMATSGRYRFPTADCSERDRDSMKKAEAILRQKEANITEILFLPRSAKAKVQKKTQASSHTQSSLGRSRISIRQREKEEKRLAQQRKKEATIAMAEAHRRRQLLRKAQRSLMLFDPKGDARKPPKDSANLILSVVEMFGLAKVFQQSTHPDFLLMTLGSPTRGAIERSYDWLIPIISSQPGLISRLPPSASCFLLLRAYGADGDDQMQLLELSNPLLYHVRDCLTGSFGQEDALRAADLILADLADTSPDRRRCARRVLEEALGGNDEFCKSGHNEIESGWLFALLSVKHAVELVGKSITYISHAIAYERGRVLRAFVLALHRYTEFAKENGIKGPWNFVTTLCEVLSIRPHICCAAMDRYSDFRDLALVTVHKELERVLVKPYVEDVDVPTGYVTMIACHSTGNLDGDGEKLSQRKCLIPIFLLNASLVILSNFKEVESGKSRSETTQAILSLMNNLIKIPDASAFEDASDITLIAGATSAISPKSGRRAVTVDQWVMLAKARWDLIARQAALSAPDTFLPRLLLCSGLPCTSLVTMIDRLGKMGDASIDRNKCYMQLMSPSATTEWGLGALTRREVSRKLLGRLSAYLDVSMEQQFSSTFLVFLSEECEKNSTTKKVGGSRKVGLSNVKSIPEHLRTLTKIRAFVNDDSWLDQHYPSSELTIAASSNESISIPLTSYIVRHDCQADTQTTVTRYFVMSCISNRQLLLLDKALEEINHSISWGSNGDHRESPNDDCTVPSSSETAKVLLLALFDSSSLSLPFAGFVIKWVPLLTRESIDNDVLSVLFNTNMDMLESVSNPLFARCTGVWGDETIQQTQAWILSQGSDAAQSNTSKIRFLLTTCGQHSIHKTTFSQIKPMSDFMPDMSQNHVKGCLSIALACSKESTYHDGRPFETTSSRNLLPDWLCLILSIARCGKKYLDLITETVLGLLPSEGWANSVLPPVVLRLYTYYPSMMGLADAKLRGVLLDAVGGLQSAWLEWRSPLDDELGEMIVSLGRNPHQRLLISMSEICKRHPLIVIRKLEKLSSSLTADGAVTNRSQAIENRSRVHGVNVQGPTFVVIKSKSLKVDIRHWGYDFTEVLWISVLDVLLSIPNEVLFTCGLQLGIQELLTVYIKLVFVQRDIGKPENTLKIRTKMSQIFSAIQKSNVEFWEKWTNTKIDGLESLGTLKDVLVICDLG